jgi:hypothetical protein
LTAYCFDTSAILDADERYYPFDVFPSFWDRMEVLVRTGNAIGPNMLLRRPIFYRAVVGSRLHISDGETPSGSANKPRIPDVCQAMGVPYMNVLGLIRAERWTF